MVDLFCVMAPGLRKEGGEWKATSESKSTKVLVCLENFAHTSGKKIFRAEAALRGLPVEQHPTAEELQKAIEGSDGRFALLPNQMIKFNG
ncbi:MAG: hypothetical protein MI807_13045 [Verrucomicrobiales bacterium]|nr:hypothetical protein [Verrucomicrobiales bacterium]